tara:strand:+ start:615 stop:1085 length:471 start_codon:yes stop_codon:yes gene_type:complete
MKNIKLILVLIVSLSLTSCGFQKISQRYKEPINLQNVIITGEKKISYTLKNNILLISDSASKNKYDARINIEKRRDFKIKNETGKVTRYSLSMTADLELTNLKNNQKKQKLFKTTVDYNIASSHSETINNEKNATRNATEQLSDDIINFISFIIKK